jgi:hypothetical protein
MKFKTCTINRFSNSLKLINDKMRILYGLVIEEVRLKNYASGIRFLKSCIENQPNCEDNGFEGWGIV